VEQTRSRLLAEIDAMQGKTHSNQKRMEAKIGAEVKNFRESWIQTKKKTEGCHREMKAKINANQKNT
jgi:3-deoxy-D-arabino-heptulosonate 7-phosphate (DAHP) synthase class II